MLAPWTRAEWMSHEGEWWIPEPNTGCWLWVRGGTTAGYSWIRAQPGRSAPQTYGHRIAYEVLRGPIPPGLQIDHLCRVRSCVNPSHMEAVDSRTNTMRGLNQSATNSRKTHCSKGHPYDEANTRHNGAGRVCRTCHRERERRRNREKRAV